jgi:hypothetical protein
MLTRIVACCSLALMALVVTPAFTSARDSRVRASLITFPGLTVVCGHYLSGTYIVEHDDDKESRGEPCTTFYKRNVIGAAEAVVSFRCIPKRRLPADKTTIITRQSARPVQGTKIVELVEYQIGGETEAHGVPAVE